MELIYRYLSSIVASAICTAMVKYAFTRRRDGSRRLIFAVGAAVVVPMIILVVATQGTYHGDDLPAAAPFVLIPLWLAIVAGTLIAGMGWFGLAKHVGDHPYCRKCGFDLFGKPEASTRCGECGAELDEKKAVVIGVRTRRYRLLAVSLFFFFLGTLIGGKPVFKWARKINWQTYKPMSWLVNDLHNSNASAAEQELRRRFEEHVISTREVKSLVDDILANQPGSRSIDLTMNCIQWMSDHDGLDETASRRLIQLIGGLPYTVVLPKLSRGMPFPVKAITIADCIPGGYFSGTADTLRINIASVDLGTATGPADDGLRHADPGPLWSKIPDGPTTLVMQCDAVVHFRSHGQEFTEFVTAKVSRSTLVATGAASETPSTRPTPADLAATWQAAFGRPNSSQDPARGLQIESTGGSTRIIAHVILIDSAGRQDIGLLDGPPRYLSFEAGKNFRQPVGPARLELIPAPEATRNNWDRSPFLDQTITINSVTSE